MRGPTRNSMSESVTRTRPIEYEINENGCYVCTSHHNRDGYPQIMVNGKTHRIHRYLWEQNHGKIPPGMELRHTCDNPNCINPAHLVPGTHTQNMQDMVDRDRSSFGENNAHHKLTEPQVEEILCNKTDSCRSLARQYGVSHRMINDIQNGKWWSRVFKRMYGHLEPCPRR